MLTELRNMLQVSRAVGRGDDSRVETLCNSALARDADDTFALGVLTNMLWRSEKYEQALPFALRILEISPNDFGALRIATQTYLRQSDYQLAYHYAKCLCAAKPSVSAHNLDMVAVLRPFVWIPKVRAVRASFAEGASEAESHSADWIAWAREYVLWYESQLPTA
jgi:tetratricopeptide (TPR) repeat protein